MKKLILFAAVWIGLMTGVGQVFAAPPGSIPVYCKGTPTKTTEVVLFCYRADTRATVVPVPEGMLFHTTEEYGMDNQLNLLNNLTGQ